jgi:hypothetical protein
VKDLTPNIPDVVEEVRGLFERYEQALIDKNVDVLDGTFWNSPHTIRLANYEHGYGFDLVYKVRDRDMVGRQSQTWVRFPDVGWKVIMAHVSMIDKEPTL